MTLTEYNCFIKKNGVFILDSVITAKSATLASDLYAIKHNISQGCIYKKIKDGFLKFEENHKIN